MLQRLICFDIEELRIFMLKRYASRFSSLKAGLMIFEGLFGQPSVPDVQM